MAKGTDKVRLYRRIGKVPYLRGKRVYAQERICLPIPSRLHNKIRRLLKKNLEIEINDQEDDVVIVLHPA